MKAVRILPTEAKGVKKAMKLSGIKVLRCCKNRNGGLLITVEGSLENQEKALSFFRNLNISRFDGSAPRLTKKDADIMDYGNMYHTEIIEETVLKLIKR